MYNLRDTIVAVSSATKDQRVIVRVTGPQTEWLCSRFYTGDIRAGKVSSGELAAADGLKLRSYLYFFKSPHSYTGEDVAEFHFYGNPCVTDAFVGSLLGAGARMAGAGEFTARAYFNGKIDLSQAEAVNEMIVSSNSLQLSAAGQLLSGRLSANVQAVRSEIMDVMSLLEAGMDFAEEDIEFISSEEAVGRLEGTVSKLKEMLAGSIRYESVLSMPAVGIAGAPNAGKSSLLNCLLGEDRVIVSDQAKTTRDILDGVLTLDRSRCVLFDCAGLLSQPSELIDVLAQEAAISAINSAAVVLFCVDVTKDDISEDVAIYKLIEADSTIFISTKADELDADRCDEKLRSYGDVFGGEFVTVSSANGAGIERLRSEIDGKLLRRVRGGSGSSDELAGLTARHQHSVRDAISAVKDAIAALGDGLDEVAAMSLREAYKSMSSIEREHIDERILDQIFSKFCIGK